MAFWPQTGLTDRSVWHFHPLQFIRHYKKCGWLSESEMKQIVPRRALRGIGAGIPNRIVYENTQPRSNALTQTHRIEANRMWRKYCVTTRPRLAAFLGNSMQETGWWRVPGEEFADSWWYAPWYGRGLLQLTHPDNYIGYWRFRGRTVASDLEARLLDAKTRAHQQRNNQQLQDAQTQAPAEIVRWREAVQRTTFDACDSAGYYWAKHTASREADAIVASTRHIVTLAANSQLRRGQTIAFYANATFRRVAFLINLPAALNNPIPPLNGLVDRYHAFAYAQALLYDGPTFPDAQGQMQLRPDDYETKGLP